MTHSIGWLESALMAKDSYKPLKLCSKHEPQIGECDWFVVLLVSTAYICLLTRSIVPSHTHTVERWERGYLHSSCCTDYVHCSECHLRGQLILVMTLLAGSQPWGIMKETNRPISSSRNMKVARSASSLVTVLRLVMRQFSLLICWLDGILPTPISMRKTSESSPGEVIFTDINPRLCWEGPQVDGGTVRS